VALPVSEAERWERRTATVAADELDAWLERAAEEGWELAAALPIVRLDGGHGLTCYVLLRRPVAPRTPR
jgi:hypothetical protein